MVSGGERQPKSEALQAVVQTGQLGFYPLNSLALSALFHNQSHSILGHRDDTESQKFRQKSELELDKKTVPVAGKIFAGLSDAFYRGKLPEVVVVTSPMAELPAFIEEFMDFLEKLCSLGFLTQKDSDEVGLLNRYVPQFVIASYGVVFDVVLDKLGEAAQNMGALSARQKERLLQKFTRGVITSPTGGYDLQLHPWTLFPKPLALNLAGSKSMFTIRTTQVLESLQIPHQFNPNGDLGVLEVELNLAFNHLLSRVLPVLAEQTGKAPCEAKDLTAHFDKLGQKMGILPGLITQTPKSTDLPKPDALILSMSDLAILHQLCRLAKEASLPEQGTVFQALLDAAKAQMPPQPFLSPSGRE